MNQGHQRRLSQQNGLSGSTNRTPPLIGSNSPLLGVGSPPILLPNFQLNPELSNSGTPNINDATSNTNINTLNNNATTTPNATTNIPNQPSKKTNNTVVYGFVYWIATFVGYIIYLLWAFIPEDILHGLGMYYYPSKYWAVAIPMYLIVCILFGLSVYFSINLIITQPLDSMNTLRDQYSQYETHDDGHIYQPESIPPLEDIPIQIINQLLYQKRSNVNPGGNFQQMTSSSSLRSKPPPITILNNNNNITSSSSLLSPQQNTNVFKPTTPPSGVTRRNPLNLSTQSTSLLKSDTSNIPNNQNIHLE